MSGTLVPLNVRFWPKVKPAGALTPVEWLEAQPLEKPRNRIDGLTIFPRRICELLEDVECDGDHWATRNTAMQGWPVHAGSAENFRL